MRLRMRALAFALAAGVAGACDDDDGTGPGGGVVEMEWTFDADLEGWESGVDGAGGWGTVVQLDDNGGVVKLDGVGDPGEPNAWIFQEITLSSTATTLRFRTSAHNKAGADAALRVRVEAGGASTTLLDWEVLAGAEGQYLWAERSVSVAAYAGQTVTLYFEQDDDGEGTHEQRYLDYIRITS
ncbi:MAG TPA: choice-of-anchor J domain-containing protein [Gemmatimonadales bacterium]|nr:choice-of-anchor J domain-containing protein [Gemmatimonadales bacterium]